MDAATEEEHDDMTVQGIIEEQMEVCSFMLEMIEAEEHTNPDPHSKVIRLNLTLVDEHAITLAEMLCAPGIRAVLENFNDRAGFTYSFSNLGKKLHGVYLNPDKCENYDSALVRCGLFGDEFTISWSTKQTEFETSPVQNAGKDGVAAEPPTLILHDFPYQPDEGRDQTIRLDGMKANQVYDSIIEQRENLKKGREVVIKECEERAEANKNIREMAFKTLGEMELKREAVKQNVNEVFDVSVEQYKNNMATERIYELSQVVAEFYRLGCKDGDGDGALNKKLEKALKLIEEQNYIELQVMLAEFRGQLAQTVVDQLRQHNGHKHVHADFTCNSEDMTEEMSDWFEKEETEDQKGYIVTAKAIVCRIRGHPDSLGSLDIIGTKTLPTGFHIKTFKNKDQGHFVALFKKEQKRTVTEQVVQGAIGLAVVSTLLVASAQALRNPGVPAAISMQISKAAITQLGSNVQSFVEMGFKVAREQIFSTLSGFLLFANTRNATNTLAEVKEGVEKIQNLTVAQRENLSKSIFGAGEEVPDERLAVVTFEPSRLDHRVAFVSAALEANRTFTQTDLPNVLFLSDVVLGTLADKKHKSTNGKQNLYQISFFSNGTVKLANNNQHSLTMSVKDVEEVRKKTNETTNMFSENGLADKLNEVFLDTKPLQKSEKESEAIELISEYIFPHGVDTSTELTAENSKIMLMDLALTGFKSRSGDTKNEIQRINELLCSVMPTNMSENVRAASAVANLREGLFAKDEALCPVEIVQKVVALADGNKVTDLDCEVLAGFAAIELAAKANYTATNQAPTAIHVDGGVLTLELEFATEAALGNDTSRYSVTMEFTGGKKITSRFTRKLLAENRNIIPQDNPLKTLNTQKLADYINENYNMTEVKRVAKVYTLYFGVALAITELVKTTSSSWIGQDASAFFSSFLAGGSFIGGIPDPLTGTSAVLNTLHPGRFVQRVWSFE